MAVEMCKGTAHYRHIGKGSKLTGHTSRASGAGKRRKISSSGSDKKISPSQKPLKASGSCSERNILRTTREVCG